MTIQQNIPLSKYSTMRVGGNAKFFCEIKNLNDVRQVFEFLKEKKTKHLVIGEGSNTLFTGDFNGLVIKNEIQGIEIIKKTKDHVTIKVGAGENWHNFVEYCVNNNFSGNENLAYIPGTVGAAPVQNIAAYGQVQEDTFLALEAFDLENGNIRIFQKPECEFEYRNSIFKKHFKDRFIILSVTYQLKIAKRYIPETSYYSRYESLQQFLPKNKKNLTLKDIFNAVIAIRKHKLPEVSEVGTLGSFFMNPFVTKEKLEELKLQFPGLQFYPVDKMQYPGLDDEILKSAEIFKVAVGWLLEELGWRGKREGNVGCSDKHALVIVVYGEASGEEVKKFAEKVKNDVFEKTGIEIHSEVNIV